MATSTELDAATLITTHQEGVWRFLRSLGCEASLAEDLTQETFLTVLQKPFEQYNNVATSAYLRKVAFNLFITFQRRSGRVVMVENVEYFETAWTQWADDDDGESMVEALRQCLAGLTDRARSALEMRFRDRIPRVEIGQRLGITEHGAKNLMQRAKKQLKECIESKLK